MSQNNGVDITEYLLDIQPSLAVVLRQKIGSQNTHYVHGLRGIASQHDGAGWSDAIADGLGSVRGWLNGSQTFVSDVNYNPYGVPDASVDGFAFTGEMTDDNGLVYLRARYYQPNIGTFTSLDPFEGVHNRPMSVNGYSWVEGNVANWVDLGGNIPSLGQRFTCEYPDEEFKIPLYTNCRVANLEDPCPQTSNWTFSGRYIANRPVCEYRNTGIMYSPIEAWRYELGYQPSLNGLEGYNTVVDQIISSASEPIPDNPCAKPYKGGLYLEGAIISMGLGFGLVGGSEKVWDFANMQVSHFGFAGILGGIIAGASFGFYSGTGGGFERVENDGTAIQTQYSGAFQGREAGIGTGLGTGVAIGGFNSPVGSPYWIYATYLAVSLGFSIEDLIGGISVAKTDYIPQGNVISFVRNGYVNPDEVAISIQNGWRAVSIEIFPQAVALFAIMRDRMSITARQWAEVYNKRTDCDRGVASYPDPRLNQYISC